MSVTAMNPAQTAGSGAIFEEAMKAAFGVTPSTASPGAVLREALQTVVCRLVQGLLQAEDKAGEGAPAPSNPQAMAEPTPEQAEINREKLAGIGNHPLGPDDQLLPPSDHRTAQEVLDSPEGAILKNLGNQEGVRDKLKEVVGDFDNDPQAAARGIAYLRTIKNMPNPDGSQRPDDVTQNDKMEGATSCGDIRAGTELAILKDSFKGGPQVRDEDAPSTIDKNSAYAWLNSQHTLAPTNDKHVQNGGNFVSDAQAFFYTVGDNLTQAGNTIRDGFVDIGEGMKKTTMGVFDTVAGVFTGNFDRAKTGLTEMKEGAQSSITGLGEVGGGAVSAGLDVSPVGMGINAATNNGVNGFVEGVADNIASTYVKGLDAPEKIVEGLKTGDWKEVGMGAFDAFMAVTSLIPGGQIGLVGKVGAESLMAAKGLIATERGVTAGSKAAEAVEAVETGATSTTNAAFEVAKGNLIGGTVKETLFTVTGTDDFVSALKVLAHDARSLYQDRDQVTSEVSPAVSSAISRITSVDV